MYLHELKGPDKEDPHDHPWNFYSFIVKGGYVEDYYPFPGLMNYVHPKCIEHRWKRFSIHKMYREAAHRIKSVEPGTVSLIFVGRRKRNWGFWLKDGSWVPWQEYENQHRGPARGTGSSVPPATSQR